MVSTVALQQKKSWAQSLDRSRAPFYVKFACSPRTLSRLYATLCLKLAGIIFCYVKNKSGEVALSKCKLHSKCDLIDIKKLVSVYLVIPLSKLSSRTVQLKNNSAF